jgi:hypothetical protein
MEQERTFADGFIIKRRDNAPEFVIANISVKVDEAITFLKNNQKNGWVNLNAKKARSGNMYLELDTFEPNKKAEPKKKEEDGNLPF